jgi:acyl carrier protein
MAVYLAKTVQAKLVLVSRSQLPDRKDWKAWIDTHDENDPIVKQIRKINELEAFGAKVLHLSSNVSDLDGMQEVIKQTYQNFETLHGVIYAAGIIGDKGFSEIQNVDLPNCDIHFQAKADGLFVLEKVLDGKDLDFCMLLSSLTSLLGGIGQVAYSSSNIFMDVFTRKHNRLSKVNWISINWDVWRIQNKTGFEAEIGKTLAELGKTPEEGMIAMERVLALRDIPQIVVSTGDLNARIDQWIKLKSFRDKNAKDQAAISESSFSARPNLQINYSPPRNETEQLIAEIWQNAIGIKQIGINDDFSSLGGHSLLAIRIISRLREAFHVNLPVSALFNAPTIAELAMKIKEIIISEIEELSDEEARQMVSQG